MTSGSATSGDRMSLFGTNGVRGVVNETLTSAMAMRLGKAIGKFLGGTVAVATDTKSTADMIKNAVFSGLMSIGCNIHDLGIIPVPALQYYVKIHKGVSGGIMITASHNTPEYNGIKCIAADGTEMGREAESRIEELYSENQFMMDTSNIGSVLDVRIAKDIYVDAIAELVDVSTIKRSKFRVVVDCGNGASSRTTPLLLQKLGIYTVTLNANPQGEFPGRPSEPTEENLSDVIALVKASGADLGVAHDLDGDRVVFIAADGTFLTGDKSLAILAKFILRKSMGGKVVTPISTSSVLETVVKKNGGEVIYTTVGSPIVAKRMREEGAVFGGEENGGLIFPEFQSCRDPLLAVAKMIECIIENGPLEDQIRSLPKFYMIKRDIHCPNGKKQRLLEHIKENCADGRTDETDGLKVFFDDGWVLARPSGTEEKFRFFSEDMDESIAVARIEEFIKDAEEFLLSI